MKTLLFISFVIFGLVLAAQTEFTYNIEGLSPKYLVIEIEGKTQSELFNKSKDWVNVTYNSPENVIAGQVDSSYIRIQGHTSNFHNYTQLGVTYTNEAFYKIEISFKAGKVKFQPIELRHKLVPKGCYMPGPFQALNFDSGEDLYKPNGEIRPCAVELQKAIINLFNELKSSLEKYLKGETEKVNSDW